MWPLSSTVVGTYIEHITSRQNLPCSLFCRLSPFYPQLNLRQGLLPAILAGLRPGDLEEGFQRGRTLEEEDFQEAGDVLHSTQGLSRDEG